MRTRHSPEELQRMSKHVLYEINQFEGKGKRLAHYAYHQEDEFFVHSVFESFLIHARNMYEFLFLEKNPRFKGDEADIRAGDFVEDYKTTDPIDEYLADWGKEMTDKRVMHLTMRRVVTDQFEWNLNGIYEPIFAQLIVFYKSVNNGHICPKLKRLKYADLRVAGGKKISAPWDGEVVIDTGGKHLVIRLANTPEN